MNINKAYNTFVSELAKRKGFLSEDNIRFYWFASMLKQDNDLDHYSLEEPYGSSVPGNKELDLMYEDSIERWCIEIKFHRNPQLQAFTHPQSAGEMFNDVRRLTFWESTDAAPKPTRYFFLYVTDDEMHQYLSNSAKRKSYYRMNLKEFYELETGRKFVGTFNLAPNGDTPKTFMYCAYQSSSSIQNNPPAKLHVSNIFMVDKSDILCPSPSLKKTQGDNCHIRLYEIK